MKQLFYDIFRNISTNKSQELKNANYTDQNDLNLIQGYFSRHKIVGLNQNERRVILVYCFIEQ